MEKNKGKEAVHLIMKTDIDSAEARVDTEARVDKEPAVHTYAPLVKTANLGEVLGWNMVEFRDYLLSTEPDFAGETYQDAEMQTLNMINGYFEEHRRNPQQYRLDLYLIPSSGQDNDAFMVRSHDNIAELSDRILQEIPLQAGGKELRQKMIASVLTITIGLGMEQYAKSLNVLQQYLHV